MAQATAEETAVRQPSWAWAVAVLALCHAQAIASFQILNILIDPIKASLAITDTQYSLLQGLAVAIFAALLGVPAARWADRRGRRNVILAGAVGWSVATVACAFVSSFGQLFAARVLMGIGEVFLFPAALSLIAALVPRERLAVTVALFGCGGPAGSAAALYGGGWAASHAAALSGLLPLLHGLEGWRSAFLLCGATGLVSAVLLLSVAEPARLTGAASQDLGEVARQIRARWRAYAGVSGGMVCLALCAFATSAWAPTVLTRVQGLVLEEAGRLTAIAALIGGVIFSYAAGMAVDRLSRRRGVDAVLVVGVVFSVLLAGLAVVGGAHALGGGATAAWCLAYALLSAPTVLGGVALQLMTPAPMRAQLMAIHLLLVNVVALPLGPFAVAVATDRLFGAPQAVGLSLAIVDVAAAALAAGLFLWARRAFVASCADQR